jgi:hypothetical protein
MKQRKQKSFELKAASCNPGKLPAEGFKLKGLQLLQSGSVFASISQTFSAA